MKNKIVDSNYVKQLLEHAKRGIRFDPVYFDMVLSLIENQFAKFGSSSNASNSVHAFLRQMHLTNILTNIFDEIARQGEIINGHRS